MDVASLLTHTDNRDPSKAKTEYKDDEMDGDASHRALVAGASSALKEQDFGSGIHEDAKPRTEPVGEKMTGHQPIFSADGAIGKHFTSEGAVGGTAEKVGGPFSKDGAIGKHFTESGVVGGNVDQTIGSKEGSSVDHSK